MSKLEFDIKDGADGKFPTATHVFEDATVAFAQITGKGKKGKGQERQYLISIETDKDVKNQFIKECEKLWLKGGLGKFNPAYHPKTWFTRENKKSPLVLWAGEKVEKIDVDNFYERAEDTDFSMKHFEKLGSGSIVNLGVRLYLWDNENGKGISLVPTVVHLKDFTKYSGSSVSLGGTKVGNDGVNTKDKKGKKPKKDKKGKKPKK